MSNPFTSVSVSGYNTDAPSDDGSAVSSNQLTWQKHLDKIGAPLKTAIEAINSNAVTAFGLTFGQGISSKGTGYQVLTTDRGEFLVASAAITFTLPAAASAGDGFPIAFVNNSSGNVTIDGSSSETINGSTSVTIPPGAFALLTCDGSQWVGFISAETGSFTATLTGYAANPTGTVYYNKVGRQVELFIGAPINGTSNANVFTMTGLPTAIQPSTAVYTPVFGVTDNTASGALALAYINSATPSIVQFGLFAADVWDLSGWTGSGTKGLESAFRMTYCTG